MILRVRARVRVWQDVSKLIKQLRDIEEYMGKLKGASKEVKRLQGSVQESEDQIRDLSAQEASLQRQVSLFWTHTDSFECESLPSRSMLVNTHPHPHYIARATHP